MLAGSRIIGAHCAEIFIRLLKVFQRLLLGCLRDLANPVELGAKGGQFAELLHEAKEPALVSFAPEIFPLKKPGVVEGATDSSPAGEGPSLFRGWVKSDDEVSLARREAKSGSARPELPRRIEIFPRRRQPPHPDLIILQRAPERYQK